MQKTSIAWRENQRQRLVEESFIEVSIEVADPDALTDVTAEDLGAAWFSNTASIVSMDELDAIPYALPEAGLWVLNGTRRLLPPQPAQVPGVGFVSKTPCDRNAVFINAPVVELVFESEHNRPIPGITITWGDFYSDYATEFIVTAYVGSDITAEAHVKNNTAVTSVVSLDIQAYDAIRIEILKWSLPQRRARIARIFTGLRRVYDKNNLLSFTQTLTASPLAASPPKHSVTYEIDNIAAVYDYSNPSGLSSYLLERQLVKVRYGYKFNGKMEWIDGGTFYLSEWRLPQNGISVTFTARDILEFATDVYEQGVFSPQGVSLYALAHKVLQDMSLPVTPAGEPGWFVDETLKSIYTTAALPRVPHVECLQYIANAACCAFTLDRAGYPRIEPLPVVSFIGEAVATDNGAEWFSNTAQVSDRLEKAVTPYAMLELNQWTLSNNRPALPLTGFGDTGFVSNRTSGADCKFADPPMLTLSFSRVYRSLISEFYIIWSRAYGEYATDFTVTAYNGQTVVAQQRISNNTAVTALVQMSIQNYDRITIRVDEWSLPYRRARIEDIPSGPDYDISFFNSFSKSEIELTKPLRRVDVQTYKYFPAEQVTEIFRGEMSVVGTQTIPLVYSVPATNVSATVTGSGSLVSATFNTYAGEVTINGTGNVTVVLTGRVLETSEVTFSKQVRTEGNVQQVVNPLITSSERAEAVADWVAAYLSNRTLLTSEWRADPRLDALDVVMNENVHDSQPVRMTDITYRYNGAFRATGEGRALLG